MTPMLSRNVGKNYEIRLPNVPEEYGSIYIIRYCITEESKPSILGLPQKRRSTMRLNHVWKTGFLCDNNPGYITFIYSTY